MMGTEATFHEMLLDSFARARAQLAVGSADTESARAGLALCLRELWDRATSAWPALRVHPEQFARRLALAAGDDADPAGVLAQLHASDLYLACACLAAVPGAAAELESKHLSRLQHVLVRLQVADADQGEVKQRLREFLFLGSDGKSPGLAQYGGRGSLQNWLVVTTVRMASRYVQEQQRRQLCGYESALDADPQAADPELASVKQELRGEVKQAIQQAVAALTPEERNLLRQHLLDGLNFEQLGRLHSSHATTIARRLERAQAAIAAEVRRRLQSRLRVDREEFEAIIGVVQSELDLSTSRILAATGEL